MPALNHNRMEKVPYIDTNLWRVRKNTPCYQHIISFLHTTWNSSNTAYFPGPQPISIERKHFGLLKKNPYVICEKADGIRHALVALIYDTKKYCVLIDRSQDIYLLPLNLPKPMFQGSIMDGELVKTEDGGWAFMIYDCLLISNKPVSHLPLTTRIEMARTEIAGIMKTTKDPLVVKVKQFWSLDKFDEFKVQVFPYKTDGLVLTPVNEPVRIGTHETMFKWKPRDSNTIDFQIKSKGSNMWGMYVQEHGKLIFESELPKCDAFVFEEDAIVECQYLHWEEPRWWRPVLVRTDKKHPNNRRTFYRTLTNISENIQFDEFKM